MTIELAWGASTHAGLVRGANEDSVIAGGLVFAVADGMGGHAAGDRASSLTVEALATLADECAEAHHLISVSALVEALNLAEATIASEAQRPEQAGMGTTAAGLAVSEHGGADTILVFNIGDSRVYRWHHGRREQISVDHSVVQELVDRGHVTESERNRHPQRNLVTRAIGLGRADVDLWSVAAVAPDRYLLCSDGLTSEVPDSVLDQLVPTTADPQVLADELVERALAAGGRDNVSVVIVDVRAVSQPGDDTAPRARSDGRAADSVTSPADDDTQPRERTRAGLR